MSHVLVYLSSPTTVFLHLDKIEAKTARATWISPVTGERRTRERRPGNRTGATFPAAPTQFFKTPDFWEDACFSWKASRIRRREAVEGPRQPERPLQYPHPLIRLQP